MKSLSLKVMTLLMAALFLSASGCFNDEMSSPEGTVKGYLKAMDQNNFKKMQSYIDPREVSKVSKDDRQVLALVAFGMSISKCQVTDVKTTLVSKKKKESVVWKGDKWRRVKNENATVEFSYKLNGLNISPTFGLYLLSENFSSCMHFIL